MDKKLNLRLLEKTVYKETDNFTKLISKLYESNGNYFLLEFVKNYIIGIITNYFGNLQDTDKEEIKAEEINTFVKDFLKIIEGEVVEVLSSIIALKKNSYIIDDTHLTRH